MRPNGGELLDVSPSGSSSSRCSSWAAGHVRSLPCATSAGASNWRIGGNKAAASHDHENMRLVIKVRVAAHPNPTMGGDAARHFLSIWLSPGRQDAEDTEPPARGGGTAAAPKALELFCAPYAHCSDIGHWRHDLGRGRRDLRSALFPSSNPLGPKLRHEAVQLEPCPNESASPRPSAVYC